MRLTVKVVPRASRNAIKEQAGGLKVYVTEPPEDGRANAAVVELLATHFGVPQKNVIVVSGVRSRYKQIDILS
jgi:uncharacterized protein (TIGR00251 family)